MAEITKKDIFDYLRNIQKSAEIEAKVNGVNVWALLGAAAFVSWQLLANTKFWDVRNVELVLRTILCAQAVYWLKSILTPPGRRKDDIRFLSRGSGDPYMWILGGIVLCLPTVLYGVFIENSLFLIVPFCGSMLAVIMGFVELVRLHGDERDGVGKLPRPILSFKSKFDWILGVVVVGVFVWILVQQLSLLINQVSPDSAKNLVLVAVLYLLVITIIDRRNQNHAIAWTYELETDLLLDVVTPEAALRRIEYRRLGARLRDVVSAFCTDLDSRFEIFDESMENCRQQIATVNGIPMDYVHERKARIEGALSVPRGTLKELAKDSERFYKYIKKIQDNHVVAKGDTAFQSILRNLFEQQKSYEGRIKAGKAELDALVLAD